MNETLAVLILSKLGIRSLANASRARQFNPLNDQKTPGVGYVPLPQTNMAAVVDRARSCVVVRGCAWSCAIVSGRARSVVRGRARSCVVVRGSAWSCVVVTHCRSARFAASAAVTHGRTDTRTRGRTTYNTPLNPPGVGWVNFFYPINVIVSIRTCVPNLGSIRGSVRKNRLLSLIIDIYKFGSTVHVIQISETPTFQ